VRDYTRSVEIGAFATERGLAQRVRFNVVLEVRHSAGGRGRRPGHVLRHDHRGDRGRERIRTGQPARDADGAGRRAVPRRPPRAPGLCTDREARPHSRRGASRSCTRSANLPQIGATPSGRSEDHARPSCSCRGMRSSPQPAACVSQVPPGSTGQCSSCPSRSTRSRLRRARPCCASGSSRWSRPPGQSLAGAGLRRCRLARGGRLGPARPPSVGVGAGQARHRCPSAARRGRLGAGGAGPLAGRRDRRGRLPRCQRPRALNHPAANARQKHGAEGFQGNAQKAGAGGLGGLRGWKAS
jgi:hypothetical protein